jgi:serine/threonine protein kinase
MLPQSWIGKTIGGRYQIEALLGQGGMSAVYRAIDPNLRRTVAIKLIHPHLSTDPNFIGRFKEEAAAVARLRHPNIVQVHDFNTDGETYFMVMEYLVGETLQARLKRLNSTGRHMLFPEAIQICTQICDAAGYAHDHELIHRDIKPANIMLDVNGQAILMDFGIVKIIGGEYHTSTGATVGTAMYMSPEQIRSERIDERSDIYSLGVTLYEMLSGHPPYQADSAVTLMMMVLNDPLPDLRGTREDIPDELLAVVYRAVDKERSKRYQSMAEMAAALQQIQGQMAGAVPVSTVIDKSKTEPSKLAVSPSPDTPISNIQLPEPVKVDVPPPRRSEVESATKDLQKHASLISTVPLEQDEVVAPASTPITYPIPQTKKTIRRDFRRLIIPAVGLLLLLAVIITGYVYFVSRQPPGLQLAQITHSSVPINAGTAKSLVSLGIWETDSDVSGMAFSPDAALLATANNRDWVRYSRYRFFGSLWQVDPANLQRYLLGHKHWVADVAFSPDGQIIATASEDASLGLWQVQDGSLVRMIETSFGAISGVDFSSNNLLLAASSLDGYIGLWQVSNGNLLRTMQKQEYSIEDVEFSPDGSLLAAASDDSSVLIWRVSDGTLAQTLQGHTDLVLRVAFSPDGTLLASASADHTIGIWSLSDGSLLRSLLGHSETVKDVAFSPDGALLASGSEDGTLRVWQVSDGQLLFNFSEEASILSVTFSPDSFYLVSGASNGVIHFWGISQAIPLEVTPTSP